MPGLLNWVSLPWMSPTRAAIYRGTARRRAESISFESMPSATNESFILRQKRNIFPSNSGQTDDIGASWPHLEPFHETLVVVSRACVRVGRGRADFIVRPARH